MKEDISKALDIDGYGASFGYNDDIFLYDSWEASQALNYLVGIEWHASDESGNLILKTLSHKQYSSLDQPEIIDAFFGELQRLHSIWDTGEHSSRDLPPRSGPALG